MSLVARRPRSEGVATLTLNNPGERNTLTAPMVAEIVAAMDDIEADESIGAIVVTGAPPAFCAGANLGNLAEADETSLGVDLRGLPAHRPQPAADARRGQRRGGRRRDEPGARLRRAPRRPPGQVRHPLPADRPAPRRRPHVDAAAHRRPAGGDGRGRVRRGARRRRGRARRSRPPLRRRRPAARRRAGDGGAGRRRRRASWRSRPSRRSRRWPTSTTTRRRCKRELEPQLWSTRQPWFAERFAALQAKISAKS